MKNTKNICIDLSKKILVNKTLKASVSRIKILKPFFDKLCNSIKETKEEFNKIRLFRRKMHNAKLSYYYELSTFLLKNTRSSGYISNKTLFVRKGDGTKIGLAKLLK